MTTEADVHRSEFRIGMLLRDTRFRSYTIQMITLVLFGVMVWWLISNLLHNLADLGKDIGFHFMSEPSSYDINQSLIPYTSRSTHATAAVVGILNTLLVAVLGCATATILGVTVGVLRLTRNWIVSKLMTVYIEALRNVPVLLQIIMWAAVFSVALPSPRQTQPILGGFVGTNRGFYLPAPVFRESAVYVLGAFVLAICFAVWFGRYARLRQQRTGELLPTLSVQLGAIIGFPLIVFFVLGGPISLEYPALKGFNFQGGIYARTSLVAMWLALSLYTSAFIAENVRAGVMAISKGQSEAAFALGLRPRRTMRLIILPQALRVIIPPLISQYLNLTKNTSLAIAVGYMDITGTLGGITLNQTGREVESLLLLMAFYLSMSLLISFVMNLYNEQVTLVERTSSAGFGFSFAKLFDTAGRDWETMKRGDAREHPDYGIWGWVILVALFYAAMLAMMLDYVFLATDRPTYWDWSLVHKFDAIGLTVFFVAPLMTVLFKHYRAVDFAVLALVMWVIAAATGFPLGQVVPWLDGVAAVVVVAALEIAVIGYLALGKRPNVTYLNRVRRAPV